MMSPKSPMGARFAALASLPASLPVSFPASLAASSVLALAMAGVAGCKSVNLNPPPVVDRSSELRSGQRSAAQQPSPSSTPADASPVAVPAPIGGGAVDQRPLGTTPIAPSGLPSNASSPGGAPLKTEPLGAKRPYSDAAMASLARADTTTQASPTPQGPAASTTPPAQTPALAWTWPATGKVTTGFGGKSTGLDFAGNVGDPVVAAADGQVTFSGTGVRNYGNFVIVRHTPELLTVYANNRTNLVKEGATVARGQKIAELGASDAPGPRLHFEIRSDSRPIDPLKYLPPR